MTQALKNDLGSEHVVRTILTRDGVDIVEVDNTKMQMVASLSKLQQHYPAGKSWAKRVVNTFNSGFFNSMTLIQQNKGEGCRLHRHPDCDEVWVILAGRLQIKVGEERETREVGIGDIIFTKKNTPHSIHVISDEPGVRLSISVDEMTHRYEE